MSSLPCKDQVVHRGFDDPPKDAKNHEEAMVHYRRVRDEIRPFVEKLPEALMEGNERAEA